MLFLDQILYFKKRFLIEKEPAILGRKNPTTKSSQSKYLFLKSLDIIIDKTNRIYDGVEAETRKSQASFQII